MYYVDKKLENMIEIYFNVEISEAKKPNRSGHLRKNGQNRRNYVFPSNEHIIRYNSWN